MSQNVANVQVGYALAYYSAYVTAGGSGSFTEFGYTSDPLEIAPQYETFDVNAEQASAPIKSIPLATAYTVKVPAMESTPAITAIAFRQPQSNISGTGANLTVLFGRAQEIYYQLKVEGPGPGTNSLRTYLFWKAAAQELGPVQIGKGVVQKRDITFRCLEDASVSTGDKIGKQVDS